MVCNLPDEDDGRCWQASRIQILNDGAGPGRVVCVCGALFAGRAPVVRAACAKHNEITKRVIIARIISRCLPDGSSPIDPGADGSNNANVHAVLFGSGEISLLPSCFTR